MVVGSVQEQGRRALAYFNFLEMEMDTLLTE